MNDQNLKGYDKQQIADQAGNLTRTASMDYLDFVGDIAISIVDLIPRASHGRRAYYRC